MLTTVYSSSEKKRMTRQHTETYQFLSLPSLSISLICWCSEIFCYAFASFLFIPTKERVDEISQSRNLPCQSRVSVYTHLTHRSSLSLFAWHSKLVCAILGLSATFPPYCSRLRKGELPSVLDDRSTIIDYQVHALSHLLLLCRVFSYAMLQFPYRDIIAR